MTFPGGTEMRLSDTVLALAILLSPCMVHAQPAGERWLPAGRNRDASFHVDRLTLERRGNLVSVWTRATYERPRPTGETYTMSHLQMDCAARTSDLISLTDYRPDGNAVRTIMLEPSERRPAPIGPGSIAATMFAVVCG